jgi:uridine kinase
VSSDDQAQSAAVEDAAAALLAAAPRLRHARLISVDGPAGSGKTTFAAALHSQLAGRGLDVTTLHMDDLYDGWTGLEPALEQRVLDQLLHPLAAGRPARWQQYDWYAGRFDRWHDLVPADVLVLEGCGSGAASYAPYISHLVWLEAGRELRIRRGLERDGEDVLADWLAWIDREDAHFAANRTRSRADLVVRTDEL